jgi:phage-related protein
MSELKRSAFIQQLFAGSGGTIQARRFIDQVLKPGEFEKFKGFLSDMQNSVGQFGDAYAVMADQTANKTQVLKNNWDILKETVGEILTPAFNLLISKLAQVLQGFNGLSDSTKSWIVNGTLAAAAFAIITGTVLLAVGAVAWLASTLAAVGLSLGTVLAVVGGVVLGIIALGSAFVYALKNSKPFRDTLKSIANTAVDVWKNSIVPFAKGIKKEFDETLQPALDRLQVAWNTKVGPVIEDIVNKFNDKVKPAIKEMLANLKDVADNGFKFVADRIDNNLIPALNTLEGFYDRHEKGINKIIAAITWLAKWIGIITGSSVFGALLYGFGALIWIMSACIYVWEGLIEVAKVFSDVQKGIGSGIIWLAKKFWDFLNVLNETEDRLRNWVYSLPGKIMGAFGSLANMMYDAGKNAIAGFIHGSESMINTLVNAINNIISMIPAAVRAILNLGSPSKLMYSYGIMTIQGYINAIRDSVPALNAQFGAVKDAITGQLNTSVVYGERSSAAGSKVINVVNNVYTQELRPEYHAAQLGTLLAGRIA